MVRFTGRDLKILRKFLSMGQVEFAKMIGCSQTNLSKTENFKEFEYISDNLNQKVNRGLEERGLNPEKMFELVQQYYEHLKKISRKGD